MIIVCEHIWRYGDDKEFRCTECNIVATKEMLKETMKAWLKKVIKR